MLEVPTPRCNCRLCTEEVKSGRYSSVSEVIRSALRLLETEEKKERELIKALEIGEQSGFVENFDPGSPEERTFESLQVQEDRTEDEEFEQPSTAGAKSMAAMEMLCEEERQMVEQEFEGHTARPDE